MNRLLRHIFALSLSIIFFDTTLAQQDLLKQDLLQQDNLLRNEILGCRIVNGPWRRAFKDNQAAKGFRYYFVSSGLRAIVDDSSASSSIEGYLNHCLGVSSPITELWDDVPDVMSTKTSITDADDSNAAMLILLATEYSRTELGQKWWRVYHKQVKAIAQRVLLENRLANGLIRVYSLQREVDDAKYDPISENNEPPIEYERRVLATRNFRLALQRSAYLMDSCEVYAALHSLTLQLKAVQDPDTNKFNEAAAGLANAIASLYHEQAGAFYILDTDRMAFPYFYDDESIRFYPHRLAQIFPELFNVPLGDDAQTAQRYKSAWQFATANGDWNASLPEDGTSNGYPAMIRGLIALKRGEYSMARQHYHWYRKQLSARDTKFAMIDQAGWALQIEKGLLIVDR